MNLSLGWVVAGMYQIITLSKQVNVDTRAEGKEPDDMSVHSQALTML